MDEDKDKDKCCICFESICATNDTCITKCGHQFHTSCILKCNGICPLCRTKLLDSSIGDTGPISLPAHTTTTINRITIFDDVLSANDIYFVPNDQRIYIDGPLLSSHRVVRNDRRIMDYIDDRPVLPSHRLSIQFAGFHDELDREVRQAAQALNPPEDSIMDKLKLCWEWSKSFLSAKKKN